MPSLRGIFMSKMTTSYSRSRRATSALSPSPTPSTSCPLRASSRTMSSRSLVSSSATSTRINRVIVATALASARTEAGVFETRVAALCRQSSCRQSSCGQHYPEDSSHRYPRLHLDAAPVIGHDRLGDGQAEAGSLTGRLGGEERIEDPRQHVGAHARPFVGEF